MWQVPGVPASSLHLILQGKTQDRRGWEGGHQGRQIYFYPFSPQIGLGGLQSRPGCRGIGPLPSSRPRPKQCRLPLPLAFIRRVTWQPPLETSPPLYSPPGQPAAATGPLRGSWSDGVGARSGPGPGSGGGRQGLGFGMQGFRPENVDPRHTRSGWGHTCPPEMGRDRRPSSGEEDLQGLGWIGKKGKGREAEVALGWGGRVTNNSTLGSSRILAPRTSQRPGWGRGQLSEDASVAQSRRRRCNLYF